MTSAAGSPPSPTIHHPPTAHTTMKPNSNSIYTHVKPDAADLRLGRAFQKERLADTPLDGNRSLIERMKKHPKPVSGVSVVGRLMQLAERAKAIANPGNATVAAEYFKGALDAVETSDHKQQVAEMVAAAQAGDREQQVALGKMIAVNVGVLIRAAGTWVQWYQSTSLGEADVPYLRNYVPQVGDVRVGTADGYITTKTLQPDVESDEMVPLFFLLSDMYRAKLFDPYKGNVADAALGTIDIAMDLMEKIDGLLQLPFTVGTPNSVFTASFTVDGTPAAHYHASARIKTANFPTGNIIAPSTNGASTKPRLDVIRAIDEYFGRFGNAMDGMGATTVHVASGIAHQFGDEFSATSAVNDYTANLYANRSRIQYNGKAYDIVPDPTIDPTDKHVYVKGAAPAAIYFDKPAGSLVHREERTVENEVLTFERALIGYAFPVTWVPRVLAVKFKD
jgi:hypothetical protein